MKQIFPHFNLIKAYSLAKNIEKMDEEGSNLFMFFISLYLYTAK